MNEEGLEILGYLSIIKDPRLERKKLHQLTDVLFIGVSATLCGCDTWEDIHLFAQEREDWLKHYIDLRNGVPSADTIARVFSLISTASPHLPLPSRSSPQGLPPSLPLVSCAAHDTGSQ